MSKIWFAQFILVIFLISSCSNTRPTKTIQTKIIGTQTALPVETTIPLGVSTNTSEQNESSKDSYIEKTKYIYVGIFIQSIGDLGRQLKLIESNPSIMLDENFKELVFNNLDELKSASKALKQLPAPSQYEYLSSLFDDLDNEMINMDVDLRQAINNVDPDKFEQVYNHVDTLIGIGEKINSFYK
jgi:hypothetical protein